MHYFNNNQEQHKLSGFPQAVIYLDLKRMANIVLELFNSSDYDLQLAKTSNYEKYRLFHFLLTTFGSPLIFKYSILFKWVILSIIMCIKHIEAYIKLRYWVGQIGAHSNANHYIPIKIK